MDFGTARGFGGDTQVQEAIRPFPAKYIYIYSNIIITMPFLLWYSYIIRRKQMAFRQESASQIRLYRIRILCVRVQSDKGQR